jgi:hypothetical protein
MGKGRNFIDKVEVLGGIQSVHKIALKSQIHNFY